MACAGRVRHLGLSFVMCAIRCAAGHACYSVRTMVCEKQFIKPLSAMHKKLDFPIAIISCLLTNVLGRKG